jgi:uncharacterized metal-binding protein
MSNDHRVKKALVIPCSGIGKVQGLISREVVYRVTDAVMPDEADTVCLALLVTGDPETCQMVRERSCITVDGCPKLCAQKNVELSGGKISKAFRVYDALKLHRGRQFGTPTVLSEEGWTVVDEMADQIADTIRHKIT